MSKSYYTIGEQPVPRGCTHPEWAPGGVNTWPEKMMDWYESPEHKEFRAYETRAVVEGCCGHPDGPKWDPPKEILEMLVGGKTVGTGMFTPGKWRCRFSGPKGCCRNQVDAFVAAFEQWLEQGAPMGEEQQEVEYVY